jgi:hypothetical protein
MNRLQTMLSISACGPTPRRSAALAGWTKGLELGGISVDLESSIIILDTGVADSWQYARFKKSKAGPADVCSGII